MLRTPILLALGLCAGLVGTARTEEAPKAEPAPAAKKEERKEGNWFTDFWVHRVGGTIGNGLKSGASKMGRAFNSIGGDRDESAGEKTNKDAEKRAKDEAKRKKEQEEKAREAREEAEEEAREAAERRAKEEAKRKAKE